MTLGPVNLSARAEIISSPCFFAGSTIGVTGTAFGAVSSFFLSSTFTGSVFVSTTGVAFTSVLFTSGFSISAFGTTTSGFFSITFGSSFFASTIGALTSASFFSSTLASALASTGVSLMVFGSSLTGSSFLTLLPPLFNASRSILPTTFIPP